MGQGDVLPNMSTALADRNQMIYLGIERSSLVLSIRDRLLAQVASPSITLAEQKYRDGIVPVGLRSETMTTDAFAFLP